VTMDSQLPNPFTALLLATGVQPRFCPALEEICSGDVNCLLRITADDFAGRCDGDGKAIPAPVVKGIIRKLQAPACGLILQQHKAFMEALAAANVPDHVHLVLIDLCRFDISGLRSMTMESLWESCNSRGVPIPKPVARGIIRKLQEAVSLVADVETDRAESASKISGNELSAPQEAMLKEDLEAADKKFAEQQQRIEEFRRKLQICDELEERRLRAEELDKLRRDAEEEERRLQEEQQRIEREKKAARQLNEHGFGDGPACLLALDGACPEQGAPSCRLGQHYAGGAIEMPDEDEVLVQITEAKMRLVQSKWQDAGGWGELCGAWQVRNRRLERLFRATDHNLRVKLGHTSDTIEAWHGSQEENVLSIAQSGFDRSRRMGQVYGQGEYFAKDPNVSIGYAKGGSFLLLCRLLLGEEESDHTWVDDMAYYVVKQHDGFVQALPLYVVQFKRSRSPLAQQLADIQLHDEEEESALKEYQRGAKHPCVARAHARIKGDTAEYLWLGWLDPELCHAPDGAVFDDVSDFLQGIRVAEVVPERNGARIGAFVRLGEAISRQQYAEASRRPYHGRWRITVDDQPPGYVAPRVCPRLIGSNKYCRSWNIRGHHKWNWGCPFQHPPEVRPTHGAQFRLEDIDEDTAKYDEINTAFLQSAPFHNGHPRLVAVHRVVNRVLEALYERRRVFLTDKHGYAMEKDLWHGTNCGSLPVLLTHGLQPPSDTRPSDACPVSGGKGLCTTLCSTTCEHCVEPHNWNKCHMYGSGVYLADMAQKSNRFVHEPDDSGHDTVYTLLFCRVCLGNPYLIEGNLRSPDAMHDLCWCQDPRSQLDTVAQEWNQAKGHDAFYVRGLAGAHLPGLGVHNSEYIVFHPYQVLPLYVVEYVLE